MAGKRSQTCSSQRWGRGGFPGRWLPLPHVTWAHSEEMNWAVPAGSSCSYLLSGNLCLPLTALLFFQSPLLHFPKTWRAAVVYNAIIRLNRDGLCREETNGPNFWITNCSHMASVQGLRCWMCAAVICCRVKTAQISFANVWHLTNQSVGCQLQMTSPRFTTFHP